MFKALDLMHNEIGLSSKIPITHLNEATIFESTSAQMGSVIYIKGIPFDTATHEDLNSFQRTWHYALTVLGDEYAVYTHIIRRKLNVNLTGKFENEFLRDIDTKYNRQFQNTSLYGNDLYITIVQKGLDFGGFNKAFKLAQKVSDSTIRAAREEKRQADILKLKKRIDQFCASMSAFTPHILGADDERLGHSELLEFLGLFVNAVHSIPFKSPAYASPINKTLKNGVKALELYPEGNIAEYLPAKRIFFGDNKMDFQDVNGNSKFAAILSIKRYPEETKSTLLDKLLHIDCEFVLTNTFAIQPSEQSLRKIDRQVIRMLNANDAATSQIAQLTECKDDLASGRLLVGYHHNTIMLLADSVKALEDAVNKANKVYESAGITTIRESLGLEAAFWAQIPTNQVYQVRSTLITSKNFVDFFPLHNYRTGYCDRNHLGSAVTLIETPSRTPMFFNFHSAGSGNKNDLTPGHTTIIGGNGSGKTVFMAFMDAQMSRYGGRSFIFDRDRGMELYIRAAGGVYSVISPDHPEEACFNPFWLKDTPSNRQFIKEWMGQLVKLDGEETLPPEIERDISYAVEYAYDNLSKISRCLSTVTQILPQNFARWSRLEKWLKGENSRSDGDYAYLFDNMVDKLDVGVSKLGFDLTQIMNQPTAVLTAVMMYLFYRIEESLDG
ncbi:MAG: VirB4 family type IV secretion/conjugal transfer ATPase, partial [Gammaproteobacteria bacterium]|nr:VirB4 family type IV secretion/conjugal transfer ATPase [Gammaproteobacteria bacterium]